MDGGREGREGVREGGEGGREIQERERIKRRSR